MFSIFKRDKKDDHSLSGNVIYEDSAQNFASVTGEYKLYWADCMVGADAIVRLNFREKTLWNKSFPEGRVEGIVMNDGFSIITWREYKGTETLIYAFKKNGKKMFQDRKKREYFITNSSKNQKIAWMQTRRLYGEDFRNLLLLFIQKNQIKERIFPDPTYDNYALDNIIDIVYDKNTFIFKCKNGLEAICDNDGNVLNRQNLVKEHQKQRENSTNAYVLYNLALEKLQFKSLIESSTDELPQIIDLLYKANQGEISDNTHATICRMLGEYSFDTDDKANAIEWFEQALKWNPKVGLKKKLQKLKKN